MDASQEVNLLHAFGYGFFFFYPLNHKVAKKLVICGSDENRNQNNSHICYSVLTMYRALDLTLFISQLALIMTL